MYSVTNHLYNKIKRKYTYFKKKYIYIFLLSGQFFCQSSCFTGFFLCTYCLVEVGCIWCAYKSIERSIKSLHLFVQAYLISPRTDWVKEWPGQVVLCASQVYWTREVHEAIKTGPLGLKDYWDRLQEQLKDVVALVRGKLTKQQRITLGALVVIDVHARDVVLDMANKGKWWATCFLSLPFN